MQTSQYSTIVQEMKDVLQQSPPQQVNLTANQSASATSTVSLAALSKLHLDGNSSPEKRKKFITELFQSVVEVVPDDKLEEITAKLMHLSDSMSNTKSTDWSFGISPAWVFYVPCWSISSNWSRIFQYKSHKTMKLSPLNLVSQDATETTPFIQKRTFPIPLSHLGTFHISSWENTSYLL